MLTVCLAQCMNYLIYPPDDRYLSTRAYRCMTCNARNVLFLILDIDEERLKGLIGLFKAVQLLGMEPRCESSCLNQSPPLIHDPRLLGVYNLPSINNFKPFLLSGVVMPPL